MTEKHDNHRTLTWKVTVTVLGCALALAVVGANAGIFVHRVESAVSDTSLDDALSETLEIQDAISTANQRGAEDLIAAVSGTQSATDRATDSDTTGAVGGIRNVEAAVGQLDHPELARHLGPLESSLESWRRSLEVQTALLDDGDPVAAAVYRQDSVSPRLDDVDARVHAMLQDLWAARAAERSSTLDTLRAMRLSVWFGIAVMFLALLLAGSFLRSQLRPLAALAERATALRQGRIDLEPLGLEQRDEVGKLATAFDELAATESRIAHTLTEISNGTTGVTIPLRSDGDSLAAAANRLATTVNNQIELVAAVTQTATRSQQAASHLRSIAERMAANAEESSLQASSVASGSAQVADHTRSLTTTINEMSTGIIEVADNASEASSVAARAVDRARQANTTVDRLASSSENIGRVVDVIATIAQETNLLALNATIEAARAGDAGRGFAVVASEIKELADATSQATNQIRTEIEEIQADSAATIEAIRTISDTITAIDHAQASIASVVEEQTAAMNEISTRVSETADGVAHIDNSITGVAAAAQATAAGAAETENAASHLFQLADQLLGLVDTINLHHHSTDRDTAPAPQSSPLPQAIADLQRTLQQLEAHSLAALPSSTTQLNSHEAGTPTWPTS